METHLNGVVACIAGDLTRDADDNQWNNENPKRWLEGRGGKLVDVMDDSVTHLLCSKAAFEAKVDKVKYTQRENCKCKLVTYEWLADAILLYDQFKRKAPTHLYYPGKSRPGKEILDLYKKKEPRGIKFKVQTDTAVRSPSKKKDDGNTTERENENPAVVKNKQPSNAAENGRKGDGKPTENKNPSLFEQNPKASKKGMRQVVGGLHGRIISEIGHIYEDPTDGFPFNVEVCCPDVHGNLRGKTWLLRLFEQKATPRLYMFSPIYFKKRGASFKIHHGNPNRAFRSKNLAMKEFEDFFFKKTGITWEERLLKAGELQRGKYRYYAPAPGGPVGYIPSKYMPGKAKDTKSRGQNGSKPVSLDGQKLVPSLKRKRDDTVGSQLVKAAKATNKTTAFDDVSTARAARL